MPQISQKYEMKPLYKGVFRVFHQAMFRVEITVKGQSRIVLTKIKLHD